MGFLNYFFLNSRVRRQKMQACLHLKKALAMLTILTTVSDLGSVYLKMKDTFYFNKLRKQK